MLGGLLVIVATNIVIYRSSLVVRFPIDILIAISIIPVSGFIIGHCFLNTMKLTHLIGSILANL